MAFIQIIGTSGFMPWESKTARRWTSARLIRGRSSIRFDAGTTFKSYPDLLLLSHLHYDHIEKLHTAPEGLLTWVFNRAHIKEALKRNSKLKVILQKTYKWLKFKSCKIFAFEVEHSSTTRTFFWKIKIPEGTIVWLPDYRNLRGIVKFLRDVDWLFLGCSALKKDIVHKDTEHYGQAAIFKTLEKFRKEKIKPKVIYLIHYGMGLRPLKVKIPFIIKNFPDFNIKSTFDGQIIKLK